MHGNRNHVCKNVRIMDAKSKILNFIISNKIDEGSYTYIKFMHTAFASFAS
jgi:hypothetical protein